MDWLQRSATALGHVPVPPEIEAGAKAAWEAYSRHTYGRFEPDSAAAWEGRAPLFRHIAMAVLDSRERS